MPINTVAILSPGDMGHAVGRRLREQELRVVTCLAGRSQRTRALSEQAGIEDLATMEEMVSASDVILSITTSEAAPLLCQEVADAIRNAGTELLFAECNAIAPQKTRSLEPIISGVGSRYVDASIIGGPPRPGYSPHIYASGEHAPELGQLRDHGLDIRVIGNEVGQASGLKMTYAASTKGPRPCSPNCFLPPSRWACRNTCVTRYRTGPSTSECWAQYPPPRHGHNDG